MNDKTLVKNAADEGQVKSASQKVKMKRDEELRDLRVVLSTIEGRRFVWKLLSHCKVFESVWHPSALIHHNSGKQDVGHFVMAEVVEANEKALLQMMQEAKGDLQNV